MTDRGKVIEGLECIMRSKPEDCVKVCGGAYKCARAVARDAVKLLKEPEPHVLTVAEINKLPTGESESVPVVMEEKYPFQKWDGGSICKWVGSRFAVSQYRESLEDMPYEWYTYGKTMRFWSGMPTEQQRRGTAWDG
jgi:hypothetical protein